MTRDETTRFFERWQQAWAMTDAETLAEFHAEDGKVTSPMFGQIRGRAAIADSYRRLFATFPDWTLTTDRLIAEDNHVAVVFTVTATHAGEFMGLPATRRRAQIHGVLVMQLGDGLIQEEMRLYDFTALLIQVGVLRAKPGH